MRPRSFQEHTRGILEEVARVVHDEDSARLLVARAGLPPNHVPAFRTSHEFFQAVMQEIRRIPGGVPKLVAEAQKWHRHSPAFAAYLEHARLRPPSEQGGKTLDDTALHSSCAELLLDSSTRTRGTAQAIGPTTLLTCAHLVKGVETVRLRPWGRAEALEAAVPRDGIDTDLDVAVLRCPHWSGGISWISSEPPAVGARVKAFSLAGVAEPRDAIATYHGTYFGLGEGTTYATVQGPSWDERHAGALLYDAETGFAWGLASPMNARRATLRVGHDLAVATTLAAVLARFPTHLESIVPADPPVLDRQEALAVRGWTLLWRTGARDVRRRHEPHLPFFARGDDASPDDIARGEAYPRIKTNDIVGFLSDDSERRARWVVVQGRPDDGRRTLALLAAKQLHDRGVQVLYNDKGHQPSLTSCIDFIEPAPVLFLIESPRADAEWYEELADALARVHDSTRSATNVIVIPRDSSALGPRVEYVLRDLKRPGSARLLEVNASPKLGELDHVRLWQHVKRVYALRGLRCEQELEDPGELLRKVDTSEALFKRALEQLASHAGIPPRPRQEEPPWLTAPLRHCITFTSSLGLTLPWALARTLVPEVPSAPGQGEWAAFDWDESGLRSSLEDHEGGPGSPAPTELAEQLLTLALRAGDAELAGAASLTLLQDHQLHNRMQEIVREHLAREGEAPTPALARMLWSAYLSCSDDELRARVLRVCFAVRVGAQEEVRRILAMILATDTWRAFRAATNAAPGSRFGTERRFLSQLTWIQTLTQHPRSHEGNSAFFQVGAIVHVIDRLLDLDAMIVPTDTSTASEVDEFWSMVLRAFELVVDEPMAKLHLSRIVEQSTLRLRGPGVHDRLARVLSRLYQVQGSDAEREDVLHMMEAWAAPDSRGAEIRSSLAHALYLAHLSAVRRRQPRAAELLDWLRRLYDDEQDRRSLRFHYLGALINAHRAAIQHNEQSEANDVLARALSIETHDDLPEVRSRLSVVLYNAHRSAALSDEPGARDWLRRLRKLGEREDASLRSRQLQRQAYENALLLLQSVPRDAATMISLMEVYRASLPPAERDQAERILAGLQGLHGWAALSDAHWDTPGLGPHGDPSANSPSPVPLQATLFDAPPTKGRTQTTSKRDIGGETTASRVEHTVMSRVLDSRTAHPVKDSCLIVIHGPGLMRKYNIERRDMTIGRTPDNDIAIPHNAVSRIHATITTDDKGIRLRDNESVNGTYVNDQRIDQVHLKEGDVVRIGRTLLKLRTGYDLASAYDEEIQRILQVDGLTKLFNHRYFHEALEREVWSAGAGPLSLMLIDIDHFERCSDTFGDRAADAVLQHMAGLVHDCARAGDVVARLGGEQFALLLPELDQPAATQIAETVRERVERARFVLAGRPIPLTVSVGVVTIERERQGRWRMVEAAEECLREAKRSGGNCVVSIHASG